MKVFAYNEIMLKLEIPQIYQVKTGQTLKEISRVFCVSERLLIQENGLEEEVKGGQLLIIPKERGNLYVVKEGDTKSLLCGSAQNYEKRNGTSVFYLGMKVVL